MAFFGKVLEEERRSPGSVPKVFQDHPTPDRILKSEEEIKKFSPREINISYQPPNVMTLRHDYKLLSATAGSTRNPGRPHKNVSRPTRALRRRPDPRARARIGVTTALLYSVPATELFASVSERPHTAKAGILCTHNLPVLCTFRLPT